MATIPTPLSLYEDGVIDFTRPPKDVLFERFNAINGTSFNPDDFVLTQVQVAVNPLYNTQVTAMPVNTAQWSRGFDIFYTRIQLGEQMAHTAEVATVGETDLYGILDTVNAAYGIYLTEADVEDAIITFSDPADLDSNGTVVLNARSTSLFFLGTYTIPVNNTVSYGIATYHDELTHFMAVKDHAIGYPDFVIARDALGQPVSTFDFLRGVTWQTCLIDHMFKQEDGSLVVIGTFTYIPPPVGGTIQQPVTNKVLFVNTRGELISATAGSLYGINFAGLKYFPSFGQGRVYALDVLGTVGGNTHGVLAFTAEGDVDLTFVPTLTSRATTLEPCPNGGLYVGTQDGTYGKVHRLLVDGSADPDFTVVTISHMDGNALYGSQVYALSASEERIAVLAGPFLPNRAAWVTESSDNVPDWGYPSPVEVYTNEGVRISDYDIAQPFTGTRRIGVAATASQISLSGQAVVYSAESIGNLYGNRGINVLGVTTSVEGRFTGSLGAATASEYPKLTNIVAMQQSTRNDTLVAVTGDFTVMGQIIPTAVIMAYDFEGNYAARLVAEPCKLIAYQHHRFL